MKVPASLGLKHAVDLSHIATKLLGTSSYNSERTIGCESYSSRSLESISDKRSEQTDDASVSILSST